MNWFPVGAQAPAGQRPNPYIDRRALSEAWYDALYRRCPGHLEKGMQSAMQSTSLHGTVRPAPATRAAVAQSSSRPVEGQLAVSEASSVEAPAGVRIADAPSLQRLLRSALQRAVTQQDAGHTPSFGTLGFDLPQSDGTLLRLVVAHTPTYVGIVVVCDPAHRARVEHCIEHMRDKLAAAGIPLQSTVHAR